MNLLSGINVIYVDDDEVDRNIFKCVLNKISTEINLILLQSGLDLIDFCLKQKKYENRVMLKGKIIIFLDIHMPNMNGLDTLSVLSNHLGLFSDSVLPSVIVFSSSRREDDIAESKRLGASDYLVKPFTFSELYFSLKSIFMNYTQHSKIVELEF